MQPSYYSITPANVRYDEDLCANAKLLYGEITALTNSQGFCWATNSYFAKLYKKSEETISRWISALRDKGYIRVDIDRASGNERRISIADINTPIDKKINTPPIDEKINTYYQKDQDLLTKKSIPIDENVKHNNTYNTTTNNTINNKETPTPFDRDFEKDSEPVVVVVEATSERKKEKKEKPPQKLRENPPPVQALVMPFDSTEFASLWHEFMQEPKQRNKTIRAQQAMLKALSKYDEAFASQLIMASISNNWQGVVFSDTDEQYQKYLRKSHGTTATPIHRNSTRHTVPGGGYNAHPATDLGF